MTPREFCYWLQGWFELCEAAGLAIGAQNKSKVFDCVQAHINVVKKTPGNFSPELLGFVSWVEAAIEFDADCKKISTRLNAIFEHVIDPSSGDTDGSQLDAHQSHGGWDSPMPGMKC